MQNPLAAQVHEMTVGLSFVFAETDAMLRRARNLLRNGLKLSGGSKQMRKWRKEIRNLLALIEMTEARYGFTVRRPQLSIKRR